MMGLARTGWRRDGKGEIGALVCVCEKVRLREREREKLRFRGLRVEVACEYFSRIAQD